MLRGPFAYPIEPFARGKEVGAKSVREEKAAPVRIGPELFAYILKLLDRVVDRQGEYHRR